MGMNRTPIDSSMTVEKAISQGGYYNTDGEWNSIVTLDEYPGKILRGRVETLVIKDEKLFLYMRDDGKYRIPGGGFDKGVLNKDQAFIETKEEAKLIVEHVRYTGVTYVHLFEEAWETAENEIPYHGTYNEVYVATYKGKYEGYIRKGLSDMELTKYGHFADIHELRELLKEPHKQALMNIFNGVLRESTLDDTELIMTAQQLQKTLRNVHLKLDSFHCIHDVDIEPENNGYVFAQYYTETPDEENEVRRFVEYCNGLTKTTIYRGFVEEPDTYKSGFLYIKDNSIKYKSN